MADVKLSPNETIPEILKFNERVKCPKCQREWARATNHAVYHRLITSSPAGEPPSVIEVLVRTCPTCTFAWYEHPADFKS